MRKILAGFLAAAMVASVGATMSFAATTPANSAAWGQFTTISATDPDVPVLTYHNGSTTSPVATMFEKTPVAQDWSGVGTVPYSTTVSLDRATITVRRSGAPSVSMDIDLDGSVQVTAGGNITLTNASSNTTSASVSVGAISGGQVTQANIASALSGAKFAHFEIDGKLYSGQILANGSTVRIEFDQATQIPNMTAIDIVVSGSQKLTMDPIVYRVNTANGAYAGAGQDYTMNATVGRFTAPTITATGSNLNGGSGNNTADITGNIPVQDAVICDGEGNPIPLTENSSGVDNDINDADGVQSDKTVYFMIKDYKANRTDKSHYDDDNYYKIKVSKGDNAKQVKSAEVVYKNFSNLLYDVTKNQTVAGTSGRHRFIKVVLNPNYTDDEFKITLDMRITPTSDAVDKGYATSSDELKIKDFSFYMKNIVRNADNDWRVGVNGLMLNPLGNDWNDVVWFDEDGDVAHMKFFADSDVDKFYSKLSTKWEHADYASYFNDQDAYIFDFTGSPKLSSTSRADLEIYNPFVDEDGNTTIDPSTAVIYQVIDGDLFDVTDSFEYKEAESGDMAFATRTRFLGTYIICEKAVEEAVDKDVDVPTDLVPEETTPSEVTPDNNGGGKAPANTGKYL